MAVDIEALEDLTPGEREALWETEHDVPSVSQEVIDDLVDKLVIACNELSGHPLRPYQEPFARRIFESLLLEDNATITALFSRQSGKALELSTKILTPTGWRTMGDLQVGDEVFAADGSPSSIIATSNVFYNHDCYRVRFSDGQEIIADADHRWTLQDRMSRTEKVVRTRELVHQEKYIRNSRSCYRYRVQLPGALKTPHADLPLDPYLLGAWLGDGSSQKAEITTADYEIIEQFEKAGFLISYSDNRNTGKATTYGFRGTIRPAPGRKSNGLLGILRTLDVIENKHIPSEYLLADTTQRLALLRGLMDTDGYADNKKGSVEFCSTTKNLAESVLYLARSLGWKATMREDRAQLNGVDCGPRYRVAWHPYISFSPFTLSRKTSQLHARAEQEWRANRTETAAVVSVELVETRPTKCIAIDHPSHLYLAGEGLVPTHNTEAVADVVATCMVFFPRLVLQYPALLEKYREGMWVGIFAPTDDQAAIMFKRVVTRLTSKHAQAVLAGLPAIDELGIPAGERTLARGKTIQLLHCGSYANKTTAHPRASIEGETYHLILLDEAQDSDDTVVKKSITPMGTETGATFVFTGTPGRVKNVFYNKIQDNKREEISRGRHKKNHFEADWKMVSKYSRRYRNSAIKAMLDMGEDSDDFRLSYRIQWLLEQGMFTTSERLDALGDRSMQSLVYAYHATPVVAGIDCARKQDRTVVTVVFVDWDHPDQTGLYYHRVLAWLDLEGMDWEDQYHAIVEFLQNYNLWKVGVDTNGLGDVVIDRLRREMPNAEFVDLGSSPGDQSKRWKHLQKLMNRRPGMVGWPGGSKVKKLKVFRRFYKEMEDLEAVFQGPNLLGKAPEVKEAHDDYPDSLSMACILTTMEEDTQVTVSENVFYPRRH